MGISQAFGGSTSISSVTSGSPGFLHIAAIRVATKQEQERYQSAGDWCNITCELYSLFRKEPLRIMAFPAVSDPLFIAKTIQVIRSLSFCTQIKETEISRS